MKNFKRVFVIIICLSLFVFAFSKRSVSASTITIKCIETNPAEDCNTSMNINYHLPSGTGGSCVYFTTKSDTNWENKKIAFPTAEFENDAFTQLNAIGDNIVQVNVTLTNLTPGTEYMYYVECGSVKSETYYFKTGSQYFNFVWTSDFHTYYANMSRLLATTSNINECINKLRNNVDFIFSTGDTIAHGGTYQWWEQLTSIDWIKNYMYVDTLGNHDWMTKSGTTVALGASHNFFSACHNNPKNGYSGQENVCYYFYYGDALFICLNTEEFTQAQYNWCEEVLKNSDAQYKFIFQHYQMINKAGGFNSAGYTRWHTLCDKYDVDVAFSGNSHVYVRSKQLYNGEVSTTNKGTLYMVAPSSDGERGEDPVALTSNIDKIAYSWAGGSKQVANSIVQVTENGVSIQLINKGGEVLDVVNIAPKRPASSRIKKDLSDVNKEEIEKDIYLSVNSSDLSQPYLKYSELAIGAIKYVTVRNKDNGDIYYANSLLENKTRVKINDFPIREFVNVEIVIDYWDAITKTLEMVFVSRKDFGEFENFRIQSSDSENLNLIWYEDLDAIEVLCKKIYVNDEFIDEIELGTINYQLSLDKLLDNTESVIRIDVISVIGDVLTSLELKYTKVVKIYASSIEIIVNTDFDELAIGDILELSTSILPNDSICTIKWSSSNTKVAKVDNNGKVTITGFGEVEIIATSKENSEVFGTITLNIIEDEPIIKTETPEPTLVIEPTEDNGNEEVDTNTSHGEKKSGCNKAIALFNIFTILGLVIIFRKKRF